MSSRGKNFRRRADGEDDDDKNTNGSETTPMVRTTPKTKSSSKSTTGEKPKKSHQKLLSFADDEDSESPFSRPSKSSSSTRLPKPSSSHKMTSVKDRVAPAPTLLTSNVQPQAGQYTKEALRELQKNTRTLASSRPPPPPPDPKPSRPAEPVVVLKGLVKPMSESVNGDDESNKDKEASALRREKDDAERRLGLMGIGKGGEIEGLESGILDQAAINAIRAKRERLRQSRAAAPDFISLDAGSNHGEAEGLSDEEPEFQTRIAMFGEKIDNAKKGVFEDVDERPVHGAQLSMEDDDEEEERKWEEEQFRKGLGKRMDDGTSRAGSNVTAIQSSQPQKVMYPAHVSSYPPTSTVPVGPPSIGGTIGGLQAVESVSISQQAEIAKKALRDSMQRLKETHGKTMMSLNRTDENLSTSLTNISAFEKSLSAAGEKFIFMQKLRDFVSVICDLLQHKAPYIEELEEQMQQLHKKRASANLERRTSDNDDEMLEVEAAVKAAMSIFSKGGTSAVAAAASAAQAAVAAIKERHNLPVQLDEFGRDINLQKRMDMTRRAEARQRRKVRSDSKRMSSAVLDSSYQRIEGESSTDESGNESAAYKSNRDLLLQTADEIFGDASEEYSKLSAVKERFEKWKRLYASSYRDAYMSLSIPAIFSPYVRLELLKWDPLHEDVDFYDMKWHSSLFDYGVPEDGSDFRPDDVDADLVPGLVEKVALPILHHDIANCWDMLSMRETKNAVSATSLVINYVPASSEALKELIASIRSRLTQAVADLVVPTWSALVMKAVPNAARLAAYRFGVAIRLLRNICLWKDILAFSVLERLALDELLGGKILPHVRNLTLDIHDAVTRTERVIASISGVWAGPSVTGARSNKLQPLVDYVLTLAKVLEKRQTSGIAEGETGSLARRLKKMLVELNEYDEARLLSRTFHLREAL